MQDGAANPFGAGSNSGTEGGNIRISPSGGTVTNCIITGARSSNNWGSASGVFIESALGLVTHCVITNNTAAHVYNGQTSKVAGVHMTDGRLENCLIADNRLVYNANSTPPAAGNNVAGLGVYGGTVRNCTVVDNTGCKYGGIYMAGGTVMYTIVAGNRSLDEEAGLTAAGFYVGGWASAGLTNNFVNCVSDAADAWNPGCRVGTPEVIFRGAARSDWQLGGNSPAIDIGPKVEAWEVEDWGYDLAGKPRVAGGRVDAGCWEGKVRATMVIVK